MSSNVVSLYKQTVSYPKGKKMVKLIVKAKTTKLITYELWEEQVAVPVGTEIVVDLDNMIAKIGIDHIDIEDDEFQVLNQN